MKTPFKNNSANTQSDIEALFLVCLGRLPSGELECEGLESLSATHVLETLFSTNEFKRDILKTLEMAEWPRHKALTPLQVNQLIKFAQKRLGLSRKSAKSIKNHPGKLLNVFYRLLKVEKALASTISKSRISLMKKGLEELAEKAAPTIVGKIQELAGLMCRGYALDLSNPDKSIQLNFYVGHTFIGTTKADTMRRSVQDIYGGHGRYGFEHRISIPHHLKNANRLILRIENAETGLAVCEPRHLAPNRTSELAYVQKLAHDFQTAIADMDNMSDMPDDVLNSIKALAKALPGIKRFAAFPLENYDLYSKAYNILPPENVPENIAFQILICGDDAEAIERSKLSLEAQSYRNFEIVSAVQHTSPNALVIRLKAGDTLHKYALSYIAAAAARNPEAMVFTTDHDCVSFDGTRHFDPAFKPAFDHYMLLCNHYIGRVFAIRSQALNQDKINNSFQALLDVFERHGQSAFHHISEILWHLPDGHNPETPDITAVEEHLRKLSIDADVRSHQDKYAGALDGVLQIQFKPQKQSPKLAIIIPTKNALEMVKPCVESVLATLNEPENTEIIVIDNGSDDPKTIKWLQTADTVGFKTLSYDNPFNWSAINNFAVDHTDADYLLFLNNDTLALDQGWDEKLRGYLAIDDCGAVGARLLYEDGTIQHAGVVLYKSGVAAHEAVADTCDDGLYNGRSQITHRSSAVTGAFLACRRDVFEEAGGFDAENLGVTFNDIDFCLKVGASGKHIIYAPDLTFHHLESKSRGFDTQDDEKTARAKVESDFMQSKWSRVLAHDPYYPAAFCRFGKPFAMISPNNTDNT